MLSPSELPTCAASKILTTASEISGPMPSPGIKVTLRFDKAMLEVDKNLSLFVDELAGAIKREDATDVRTLPETKARRAIAQSQDQAAETTNNRLEV